MSTPRLFPIARRGDRPVLVMVPGAGGGLVPYLRLGAFLGQTYNVYAVRAAGLVPDEEPEFSVPEMADSVLAALEPSGLVPEAVFGWSMGGLVAYEVCATLAGRGQRPDLVMVDCSPFRLPHDPERDAATREVIVGMLGPRPDEQTLDRVTRTFHAHIGALTDHEVRRHFDGRVQLLICTGASDLDDDREAAVGHWRSVAPNLRTGEVDGDHFDVFDPERLPQLSGSIGEFLGMPVGVSG